MGNIWSDKLRDAILSNSAIRDGLQDDAAQPLIDWGLELAEAVGEKMSQLPPEQTDAAYDTYQGALSKLLTRLNWLITFSQKKGEDWTRKTLAQINELSQTLFGEQAPLLSEDEMLHMLLAEAESDNKSRIAHLMKRVSPKNNREDLV